MNHTSSEALATSSYLCNNRNSHMGFMKYQAPRVAASIRSKGYGLASFDFGILCILNRHWQCKEWLMPLKKIWIVTEMQNWTVHWKHRAAFFPDRFVIDPTRCGMFNRMKHDGKRRDEKLKFRVFKIYIIIIIYIVRLLHPKNQSTNWFLCNLHPKLMRFLVTHNHKSASHSHYTAFQLIV